ncbi:hypothetical protein CA13_15000 [Planctomycetes bacterium CA13]|uniref:Cellulase (Glycosyl hydrolase family 5) n=1 Tax=Novipirellula herctigrandis TaxID=2527986 RepID=A0A5C5YZT7_9BACT|nr:hypothetical protein CA13_15000 [Planctomycetes bacterium CA13]
MIRIVLTLVLATCFTAALLAQAFPFVIPGDDAAKTATDRSGLLDKPAGAKGFVEKRGNQFFVGDQRFRIWGVNTCFASNFPSHEEADRVAPHLAKLGINAVRFHHMDMQAAPNGIWNPQTKDGERTFDPEMVDRLDYFLAKLHEHGIYANLNMHVSRELSEEEGFPVGKDLPWWGGANKWVMYYDRDIQAKVKSYCRDLLTHKNPYRDHLARVDDPGIAVVEMLNENYFSEQGYDLYRRMPKRFQQSFILAWNTWLRDRYETQQNLTAAWEANQIPLGDPVFPVESFDSSIGDWEVSLTNAELPRSIAVQGPAQSPLSALRIAPLKVLEQTHFQQLHRGGLSVEVGTPVTLSFWVRADKTRTFRAEISTSLGGEWRDLGIFEDIVATPKWTQITRVVLPKETIQDHVNLVMTIGNETTPIEFAGIELREGVAPVSLPKDQNLFDATIAVPSATSPVAAHNDMKTFMVDTEIQWVKELKAFLTEELGVKVPITASQINYHPAKLIENELDFVDLHNYWHHPIFPSNQPWSASNWTIGNDPMEAIPEQSGWPANSILMRTGWRYADLPMTMSEWNYPEPSFYAGGCVPIAAIIMGLQDWDGVYFFDYDASGPSEDKSPWFRDQTTNFFSFNGAPVKLALMSQMANVILRGDLNPIPDEAISEPGEPIDGRYALSKRLGVRTGAKPHAPLGTVDIRDLHSPNNQVAWKSDGRAHGYLTLNTPATRAVWGTIAKQSFEMGGVKVTTSEIEPNYGFVLLSSTDGQPIESAETSILTVVSHSENQGMKWNEEKTSVGSEWGHGPTMVTSFAATVFVPRKSNSPPIHCYALDGTGKRIREIPVTPTKGGVEIKVSPAAKTIWYELR